MSLFDKLYVNDNEGNQGVYRRTRSMGDVATYINEGVMYDPSVFPIHQIEVRSSVSGKPSDPGGITKRQNLILRIGKVGADQKVHAASVSLTIAIPSSGVIDTDLVRNMLHRVVALAVDYGKAIDSTPGAGEQLPSDPSWVESAFLQEL